jgi:hypothetical protein
VIRIFVKMQEPRGMKMRGRTRKENLQITSLSLFFSSINS